VAREPVGTGPIPVLAVIATALFACGPKHFSGALDPGRLESGEVYVERVELPGSRTMVRAVAYFEAPPWRLYNAIADLESHPLWHPAVQHKEILSDEGDVLMVRVHLRPVLGIRSSPVDERVRLDAERHEVSMVAFENDWVQDLQTILKLEPMGSGTLASLYSHAELKPWWARASARRFERTTVEAVHNLRQVMHLPRYDERPVATGAASRKIAVPAFTAEGVSEELARTVTRIFAEALMRHPGWNVVTQDELFALLHHEQDLQLAGCDDAQCAMDVGAALEASHVITGSVGRLGEAWVVSLALMRLPDGHVERRVSETVATEAALGEQLRAAAERLAQ
jgi:hypothetical protein